MCSPPSACCSANRNPSPSTSKAGCAPGVTAKDLILAIIGKIGVSGGTGHVIRISRLDHSRAVDGRAHDGVQYVHRGRRARRHGRAGRDHVRVSQGQAARAPRARTGTRRSRAGEASPSDPGARFDASVDIDASALEPMITYGTNPGMVLPIGGGHSRPARAMRSSTRRSATWDFTAAMPCSASRSTSCSSAAAPTGGSEDLQAAAQMLKGRKVAPGVRLLIVPGSQEVKRDAEAAGLRRHIQGGRRRLARVRLLDVPGDERRHGRRRPVFGQHQQPQFRRPAGRRRAHPAGEPVHRGGERRARPHHRSAGDVVMEPADARSFQDRGRSPRATSTPIRSFRRGF